MTEREQSALEFLQQPIQGLDIIYQEAMNALRVGRTSFVIAHRLSTIRGADKILVMDGGRIVEQGSHAELMQADGPYAALHAAQFAGQAT